MENTFGRGHCLSSFHASLGRPSSIVTGSGASRGVGGEGTAPPVQGLSSSDHLHLDGGHPPPLGFPGTGLN